VTSRERTNVHQVFHLPGEERSKEIKEEEKEKKNQLRKRKLTLVCD